MRIKTRQKEEETNERKFRGYVAEQNYICRMLIHLITSFNLCLQSLIRNYNYII